jgi:hypothetical protein
MGCGIEPRKIDMAGAEGFHSVGVRRLWMAFLDRSIVELSKQDIERVVLEQMPEEIIFG